MTTNRDTDLLDQIEDFLVNNFGEDEKVSGSEALEMLTHISGLIDSRREREQ